MIIPNLGESRFKQHKISQLLVKYRITSGYILQSFSNSRVPANFKDAKYTAEMPTHLRNEFAPATTCLRGYFNSLPGETPQFGKIAFAGRSIWQISRYKLCVFSFSSRTESGTLCSPPALCGFWPRSLARKISSFASSPYWCPWRVRNFRERRLWNCRRPRSANS